MYISEMLINVGRKLSFKKQEFHDNSKAFYGKIPAELTSFYQEEINKYVDSDPDLYKMAEMAGISKHIQCNLFINFYQVMHLKNS